VGSDAFADFTESTSDPLERRIAAEFWRWLSLPEAERFEVVSDRSALALAIEHYMCGVFRYDKSGRSAGWWCDGAIGLSISQLAPAVFRIVGAAYWAKSGHGSSPFFLAPFELEFYFDATEKLEAERIIVRFGATDEFGEIDRVPYDANPARVIRDRPTENRDWAFAVELS
jgi:hypothetical protein